MCFAQFEIQVYSSFKCFGKFLFNSLRKFKMSDTLRYLIIMKIKPFSSVQEIKCLYFLRTNSTESPNKMI
ncbi:MAG: hypothetical protein BGO87_05910 [Flavobacteriia bacterium 40-80]|nr:MAG: hypothetical protein BGO87_05910 [Flavobacteriia bacterium 40-80]